MAYKIVQLYDKNNNPAYPIKGPVCNGIFNQEDSSTYWYKFASLDMSGTYTDIALTFQITKAYNHPYTGQLFFHARRDTTPTITGVIFTWITHTDNVRPYNFCCLMTDNKIDFYYKRTYRWEDYHITVLETQGRSGTDYYLDGTLHLYSHADVSGLTDLPSATSGLFSVSSKYKVGDFLISTNGENPATYYGGSWELIMNRFLVGAGDAYSNTAQGGASSVTLSKDNLPKHSHWLADHTHWWGAWTSENGKHSHWCETSNGSTGSYEYVRPNGWTGQNGDRWIAEAGNHNHWVEGWTGGNGGQTGETGGGAAFSIIPPYYAAYLWRRNA